MQLASIEKSLKKAKINCFKEYRQITKQVIIQNS